MFEKFLSKLQNYTVLKQIFGFNNILQNMFPINNFFGFNTQNMELYPRRRATEFYYQPQPLEEYQSRYGEHPSDKLKKSNESANWQPRLGQTRIVPARNSDMRMFRNSYFS